MNKTMKRLLASVLVFLIIITGSINLFATSSGSAAFGQIKTPVKSMDYITVHYSNAPSEINAWIGIFPVGDTTNDTMTWKSLQGKTSGDYGATAPVDPGKYCYRIYNANDTLVVQSDPFIVSDTFFREIKTEVKPKEYITVKYYQAPKEINAWIGIFPEGDTTNNTMTWKSLQGNVNGEFGANAPETPGKYYYRIYNADDEVVAQSETFTISGSASDEASSKPIEGVITTGEPLTGTVSLPVFQLSSDILAAAPGNGLITLQWKEAASKTGLDGYYLYKGTSPGGESASPMFDFPVTQLTYKDTNVNKDTTYYYTMKPVYNGGTRFGAVSNEVSAKADFNTSKVVIVLTIGQSNMLVNGVSQSIDAPPVLKGGRTFVPISVITQALGGKISWNKNEKKVTISINGKTIELWVGKTEAKVNGQAKALDAPPYISDNGRTMVPLRFIIENLGCKVTWNGPAKTITIDYNGSGSTGNQTDDGTVPSGGTPSDSTNSNNSNNGNNTNGNTTGTNGNNPASGNAAALADNELANITPVASGVIHTGKINPQGETWTPNNGPHIVERDFSVNGDTAPVLVIEPGTVVLFKAGAAISIGFGRPGGLKVNGTPEAPVLFAANTSAPHPGFWDGIRFDKLSVKDKSYIRNAVIQSAGDGNSRFMGAIDLLQDTTGVELTNVKIKSSIGYGLLLEDRARLSANSSNVSVTGTTDSGGKYGCAISTGLYGSNGLPTGGTFQGNFRNAIEIKGNANIISENFIWKNLGIPYEVTVGIHLGGSNNPVFTIDPGVVALFGKNDFLKVGQYGPGTLVANAQASSGGASSVSQSALQAAQQLASSDSMLDSALEKLRQNKMIVFGALGKLSDKGVWSGIEILQGSVNGTVLNGFVMSGAGNGTKGALSLKSTIEEQLKLANTLISGSVSKGLEVLGKIQFLPGCAGNIFTGNNIPLSLSPFAAGSLEAGNSFLGNINNYIEIVNGNVPLSKSVTWLNFGIPYMMKDNMIVAGSVQEAILTLSEGVSMIFGKGFGMDIGRNGPGSLVTLGTAANPVSFTSLIKTPGSWNGLHFFNQMGAGSSLSGIFLENAVTGIIFDSLPGADILKNSTIQFCQKLGIERKWANLADFLLDFLLPGLGNIFNGNGINQK